MRYRWGKFHFIASNLPVQGRKGRKNIQEQLCKKMAGIGNQQPTFKCLSDVNWKLSQSKCHRWELFQLFTKWIDFNTLPNLIKLLSSTFFNFKVEMWKFTSNNNENRIQRKTFLIKTVPGWKCKQLTTVNKVIRSVDCLSFSRLHLPFQILCWIPIKISLTLIV